MKPRHILAACLFAPALFAQPLQPLDAFWFAEAGFLTADRLETLTKELKDWKTAGVFDQYAWRSLPPTFEDPKQFISLANSFHKTMGGHSLVASFPVGLEGWETSYNQKLAEQGGWKYDPAKAMSHKEWLAAFANLQAEQWAWVLERPAKMMTPEQAAQSAVELGRFAKAHGKKFVMWLSTNGLRGPALAVTQAVCKATRGMADDFVWMDLPGDATIKALGHRPASGEEGRVSAGFLAALDGLLDEILELTPKEKVHIQWTHSPRLPTQNVEGTTAYIAACQKKGINKFVLFAPLQLLAQEPWHDFYTKIPRSGR